MFFQISDVLAIAKLSWELYHGCLVVARGAPDDYRQMVNELASLQGILRTLRDDTSSDNAYLDKLDENRRQMLDRCLESCLETLKSLKKLLVKYRELGLSDGHQFWLKIKWSTKQKEINSLKNRIMANTCNLSLCMSSMGKSVIHQHCNSDLQANNTQLFASAD